LLAFTRISSLSQRGIGFALSPAALVMAPEAEMDIAKRLARELGETTARLRHDAHVAFPDEDGPAAADARSIVDAIDHAQRSVEREMTLATRSRLHERAGRLIDALDRLRDGSYGACEECGRRIPAARLAAVPEVTTCLPCQSRREAVASRAPGTSEPFFAEELN
jgi:RNA polymerase-binding transcription factor DksA